MGSLQVHRALFKNIPYFVELIMAVYSSQDVRATTIENALCKTTQCFGYTRAYMLYLHDK